MTTHRKLLVDVKEGHAIDFICEDGRTEIYRKLPQDYIDDGRDVAVMDADEWSAAYRQKAIERCPPTEITEDDFMYYLEVLPPCRWERGHGYESFFMSERETMDITLWLVRIGERYFKLNESDRRRNSEIVDIVYTTFFRG